MFPLCLSTVSTTVNYNNESNRDLFYVRSIFMLGRVSEGWLLSVADCHPLTIPKNFRGCSRLWQD